MINIIEYKNQEEKKKDFLALFQQCEQGIYRMAYIYVKNKEDALDIVQETAYRSFLKFSTLNDLKYFKTWIIKITINCAIDSLRKNKKEVQLNTEVVEFIPNSKEDIPLSLTLQDLLDTLNEDEKSVILLKYYQGYSFSEISEILIKPLSTVKSVLYRALYKLREKTRREDMYGQ
ncbi:sigma-70 family RNA polymerase sigma factor [Peribacillus simplex]|uniref:Sigma-70 family RNA polymerase sigma factor n=2 Tax=Peribacillus TaxID=2675229 RepID=A0AA90T849_9BACI|nr:MULTISPECIES: sigma-70 family RNA polymerase sigma factor [Peribacillus]MDP1420381.1 sigma-70 family RNA polymerase sigma factor [Peribacillus simplex]MDP1453462.1 sigma-70 family RNA polymerase sigma factor [Peribacillus frigoritolerans]